MKKKRILCVEVSGECQYLQDVNRPILAHLCECVQGFYCVKNTSWKPITKDACKNCKEGRYQGFTREQTIDKIMRALCAQVYGPTCEKCEYKTRECKQHRTGYRTYAEAILKTILEDNNVH